MTHPPTQHNEPARIVDAAAAVLYDRGYTADATRMWTIAGEMTARATTAPSTPAPAPAADPVTGLRYSPLRPPWWYRRQARHENAQDTDPDHDRTGSWEACARCRGGVVTDG